MLPTYGCPRVTLAGPHPQVQVAAGVEPLALDVVAAVVALDVVVDDASAA